jgi:predicted ester cyclase
VACRISRRYVAMLAEGVAEVKAAQGHDISPEVMAGRLLIGAVVYVTAGGSLMAQIPDFRFIFTDEWPNPL